MTPPKLLEAAERGAADLGDDFLPKPWPKFIGHWPRLTGRQEPEFWHGVAGDESDGDAACDLGFEVGSRAMPFQWWALRKICSRLDPDDDGIQLWTHPDVCLVIPRQNGKTQIAILRILFGLFILGETIVFSAQRWITAEDVYDRLMEIIDAHDWLKDKLQPRTGLPDGHSKAGQRGTIELANGGKIRIGLRSGDLGRGLTKIDLVIFDEAYKLTEESVSALTGAQIASENAQTIYLSTPPLKEVHPYCHVLAGMRRLGRRRAKDLFFAEWSAPRNLARSDPDAPRLANPAHGVIHRERDMQRELRKASSPLALALFEADFLGWGDYPPDELDREPLVRLEVWRSMKTDGAPDLVGERIIAVDRTDDRRWWAIACAQRTSDGKIHFEVGYWRVARTADVALYLTILVELWDPKAIIVDARGRANTLVAEMKNLGFDLFEANTPQVAKAYGGFMDAIPDGISHSGQQILEDAIESARTRKLPLGDLVLDTAEAPASQLKASTLAYWGVLTFTEEVAPSADPIVSSDAVDLDELDLLEATF